ncbi:hypothetical protein [Streptomyces asiaticus]
MYLRPMLPVPYVRSPLRTGWPDPLAIPLATLLLQIDHGSTGTIRTG